MWCHTGKSFVAPLVEEMLQRIGNEVARYERVITYWPVFGPMLEGAVCASMRETTGAVTRQCGLAQVQRLAAYPCAAAVSCLLLGKDIGAFLVS